MSNIYALIPARGGSKRLHRKNIALLNGKPMILYSIEAASNSEMILKENIFVSTEDEEIKAIVSPFVKVIDRPIELALDNVWTQDVINHFSSKINLQPDDLIVVIQANSPQMTPQVIDECISMLLTNRLWQVHTVDKDFINNGAVQVMYKFVSDHKGKANYNGVVVTDFVDVHTQEDLQQAEILITRNNGKRN